MSKLLEVFPLNASPQISYASSQLLLMTIHVPSHHSVNITVTGAGHLLRREHKRIKHCFQPSAIWRPAAA